MKRRYCRICLCHDDDLIYMFHKDHRNINHLAKLNKIIPEMKPMKNRSRYICKICCNELDISYKFHEKCLRNHNLLDIDFDDSIKTEDEANPIVTDIVDLNTSINESNLENIDTTTQVEVMDVIQSNSIETIESQTDIKEDNTISVIPNSAHIVIEELVDDPIQPAQAKEKKLRRRTINIEPSTSKETENNITIQPSTSSVETLKFKCIMCTSAFAEQQKLEEHIKIAHALRKILEYDFGSIQRTTKKEPHKFIIDVNKCIIKQESILETTEEIKNNLAKGRAETSVSNIEEEILVPKKSKKKYECIYCAKLVDNKVQLTKHLQLHEISLQDKKCFKCKKCDATFNDLYQLSLHVRSEHDNIKTYKCPDCSVVCSNLKSLRTHSHVHDPNKKGPEYVPHKLGGYKCLKCNKRLISRTSVWQHLQRHTGTRPFQCKKCPANFKTGSCLGQHMATQHEPPRFPCSACNRVFNYKVTLLQHLASHVKEQKI